MADFDELLTEQLAAARLAELKVPMPLQGLDEGRQKWYESLATGPISRVPGQEKGVLDLWSISSLPSRPRRVLPLLQMVEQPHCGAAGVTGRGRNLVEQLSFLCSGGLTITRHHLLEQLPPRLKTQRQ